MIPSTQRGSRHTKELPYTNTGIENDTQYTKEYPSPP